MPPSNGLIRFYGVCGRKTLPGWVKGDGFRNARLAKLAALRKMLASSALLPRDEAQVPRRPDICIHDARKPFEENSEQGTAPADRPNQRLLMGAGARVLVRKP